MLKMRFFKNKQPKNANQIWQLLIFAWLSLAIAACGGESYRGDGPGETQDPAQPPPPTGGNPVNGENDDPSLPPAEEYTFAVTAPEGSNPEYSPGKNFKSNGTLEIRVRGMAAGRNTHAQFNNAPVNYRCVQFDVTVEGKTVTTQTLAVNGGDPWLCPEAVRHQTLNFSDRLGGSDGAKVTISNPRYEWRCQNQNQMDCPMAPAWWGSETNDGHKIKGRIEVKTAGTRFTESSSQPQQGQQPNGQTGQQPNGQTQQPGQF